MGFFKLPFLNRKKKEIHYYLGLFLKEEEGVAYAIEKTSTGLVVRNEEKFTYADGWNHLVEDIDQVLVKLEKDVSFHFVDTIFFVYSQVIDQSKHEIKKEYLLKIKELVKNLELKALGYIECFEAVVNFIEKRDDIPLTSILLELEAKHASLFVYKGGRLVFRKSLDRSEHLATDLSNVLSEAKKNNLLLPSRIILYNSKDLDRESSVILSHKWPDDLFVQLPKVEIMRPEDIRDGLISVFGSQLSNDKEVQPELKKEEPPKEVMGFVVGADVPQKPPELTPAQEEVIGLEAEAASLTKPSLFKKLKQTLTRFPVKSILIVVGIAVISVALFLNEYLLHTAVLKIFLPAKTYQNDISLTDFPVTVSTESADLSQSAAATGSRDTGDKATGKVTVYSFDDSPKSIAKNTTLTANGLSFFTTDDIQVASSSEVSVGAKQAGKTDVGLTAADIGPQYNLDKGTRFQIDGLSESTYFAQNDNALSGGSKKTVKTVARKDIDNLTAALLAKTTSSEATLLKNDDPNVKPLATLTNADLTGVKSSKEVGEESDTVTVSATGIVTYYLYNENTLKTMIADRFKDQIPSGFSIDTQRISYAITSVKKTGDAIDLEVHATVKATQDISSDDVLSTTRFKSRSDLDSLLRSRYKATGYELTVKDPLPFFKDRTPIFTKNLIILISSL